LGTPVPGGLCSSKPWPFSSACKNLSRQHPLRAEIRSSEKVDLGGSKLAFLTLLLVYQSLPDCLVNAGGIAVDILVFRFWISIRSGDIRDRSLKLSEVVPNIAFFALPEFFLGGRALKFLDLDYKIEVLMRLARGNSEISRWKKGKNINSEI